MVHLTALIRDAFEEIFADFRLIQVFPDDNQLTEAWLARVPKTIRPGVEHGLHALKDNAFALTLDLQDAFAAIDVRSHRPNHRVQPGFDSRQIERACVA